RAKLEDPDYIQSYARGNYMLSKDGEQIFYLPEKENK
ncbi:MAG: septum formation initiator family protein, partial [Solobacterium sp.]|nr:septum formation initiator family protein [Solobacterium sp.]